MKKILATTAVMTLAVVGSSFAKETKSANPLFVEASVSGAHLNIVSGFSLNAEVALGQDNLFGSFAGRGNVKLNVAEGSFGFGLGADLIIPFGNKGTKDLYAGLGLGLNVRSGTSTEERFFVGTFLPINGSFGATAELMYKLDDFNFDTGSLGIEIGTRVYL